jgi:2OG-Fe(II) oxygenase superfamily
VSPRRSKGMVETSVGQGTVETTVFVFEPTRLLSLAKENRRAYADAEPFPHIAFDDFLPAEAVRRVVSEFPKPKAIDWVDFDGARQKKLASKDETQVGEWTRLLLYQFNSSVFLSFLEELTGIEGLIPDPHFWGGGLHQIERGGFLKIHADFNKHPRLKLDRRLNLLLYMNEGWEEAYGGHFELWDKGMTRCVHRFLPIFNRCVIFNTTATSYHGHPDPLTCPEGTTRKSLALYYYSNGRSDEVSQAHGTLYRRRPGERIAGMRRVRSFVKRLIPPIVFEARDYVRGLKTPDPR